MHVLYGRGVDHDVAVKSKFVFWGLVLGTRSPGTLSTVHLGIHKFIKLILESRR